MEVIFNKEEKKYISETLVIALEDIRKIYEIANQKNIFLNIRLDGQPYLLAMNSTKTVLLTLDDVTTSTWIELWKEDKANLFYEGNCILGFYKKKNIIPNSLKKDEDITLVIEFIANYDVIREKIINELKGLNKNKSEMIKKLHEFRCKYANEVLLDLGENTSTNMQQIQVEEENGKKVGTIDFGSRIVKIITKGDIVLTKIESAKEKIKTIGEVNG